MQVTQPKACGSQRLFLAWGFQLQKKLPDVLWVVYMLPIEMGSELFLHKIDCKSLGNFLASWLLLFLFNIHMHIYKHPMYLKIICGGSFLILRGFTPHLVYFLAGRVTRSVGMPAL